MQHDIATGSRQILYPYVVAVKWSTYCCEFSEDICCPVFSLVCAPPPPFSTLFGQPGLLKWMEFIFILQKWLIPFFTTATFVCLTSVFLGFISHSLPRYTCFRHEHWDLKVNIRSLAFQSGHFLNLTQWRWWLVKVLAVLWTIPQGCCMLLLQPLASSPRLLVSKQIHPGLT